MWPSPPPPPPPPPPVVNSAQSFAQPQAASAPPSPTRTSKRQRKTPPSHRAPPPLPHHGCLPHSHWQSSLRPTPSSTPSVSPLAASCAPSSPSSRLALSASSPHNSPMRLDAMHAVRPCLPSAVSCSSCGTGAAPCAGQTHDLSTRPPPPLLPTANETCTTCALQV